MNTQMGALIGHWLVSGLALAVTAAIVPGFRVRGFVTALIASFLIGLANYMVWPVLFFFTLPLTIITFGLFIFVVDAIVLRLVAALMTNFEISGWLSAIAGAVILSLMSSALHYMLI